MRRLLTIVAAGVLCGLAVLGWGWRQWTAPGPGGAAAPGSVQVRIRPGLSLSAAADTLAAAGLLRDPRVLSLGGRLSGRAGDLQAGLYELPQGASPRELLDILVSGRTVPVRVTVPEGLEAPATAAVVAGALGFPAEAFLAAADSAARELRATRGWLPGGLTAAGYDTLLAGEAARHDGAFHWSDGYLAPDTYHFAEGTGPAAAARAMVDAQAARLDSVLASPRAGPTAELAPHALLTLASIVESEARRADERALVAAVYANRLSRGMRLEADPTVAYATGKRGQRLYYRDLEVASAFNTYRRAGLPPGAIGAPGRASLAAAARPDTACDALYFVSDGADGHLFARTLAEHEANVRRFRRLRAAQRSADD